MQQPRAHINVGRWGRRRRQVEGGLLLLMVQVRARRTSREEGVVVGRAGTRARQDSSVPAVSAGGGCTQAGLGKPSRHGMASHKAAGHSKGQASRRHVTPSHMSALSRTQNGQPGRVRGGGGGGGRGQNPGTLKAGQSSHPHVPGAGGGGRGPPVPPPKRGGGGRPGQATPLYSWENAYCGAKSMAEGCTNKSGMLKTKWCCWQ